MSSIQNVNKDVSVPTPSNIPVPITKRLSIAPIIPLQSNMSSI